MKVQVRGNLSKLQTPCKRLTGQGSTLLMYSSLNGFKATNIIWLGDISLNASSDGPTRSAVADISVGPTSSDIVELRWDVGKQSRSAN
jgi:hypothetical protein